MTQIQLKNTTRVYLLIQQLWYYSFLCVEFREKQSGITDTFSGPRLTDSASYKSKPTVTVRGSKAMIFYYDNYNNYN